MKCRSERSALAAGGDVGAPEVGDGRDGGAGGDDVGVSDLQRERVFGVRFVSDRLTVAANRGDIARVDAGLFEQRVRGITKTLADLTMLLGDIVGVPETGLLDRGAELLPEIIGVGLLVSR